MIEYSVILRRGKDWQGKPSGRPDVTIFRDESREKALQEMHRYCKSKGFTVEDRDGRHTVADIVLQAKEPIVGAPVLSEESYHTIFDD